MTQPREWYYWAIRLHYMPGLAGVWHWPDANPRHLDGIALFRTREQAREAVRPQVQGGKPLGHPVRARVTIEEVSS
jgi:hypothetical protein